MTSHNQALIAPLIYYDLLERPLTALEIFKYLRAGDPEISFFSVWQELKRSNLAQQKNGLYFLPGQDQLIAVRQKRMKLAQMKWKKLKRSGKYLALVPWLRLAAVTGSLTAHNTKESSDFDLLIVLKKNRLWLGRLLLTGLVGLLKKRRHGQLTQDRLCLNCYLTENNLEITAQAKSRDWHSAQEYGRLTPILEIQKGSYAKFVGANNWLSSFLKNYPWPNSRNAKKIKAPLFFSWLRQTAEALMGGRIGDTLEKIAGQWQKKRINKKRLLEQSGAQDQVFVSDYCLMFHPQSKSDRLMKEFNLKMAQYYATDSN
ncbi:MAG TPA: hypothetical protein P5089_03880 [Candidatus Portnoybacteria bacterium]|nr:hypothetical protein [Candidatus Portnoybacteria bacterium]